jgi:hypothetical protein
MFYFIDIDWRIKFWDENKAIDEINSYWYNEKFFSSNGS